jgi:recombinational DNA repair protein RecR
MYEEPQNYHEVPPNYLVEVEPFGTLLCKEAAPNVHRCTGCVGLTNAPICHILNCRATARKDGKNVILVPYKED